MGRRSDRKTLRDQLEDGLPRFQEAVDLLTTQVRYVLRRYGLMHPDEVSHRVTGRVKSVTSFLAKIGRIERQERRRIRSLREAERYMDDIAGIRVVCPYLPDVTLVYGYIGRHHAFRELSGKFVDYIFRPKSGYRGLHTVVRTNTSFGPAKCEVQMRTGLQDAWAVKSHDLLYKLKKTELERVPKALRNLLTQHSDALYNEDTRAVSLADLVKDRLEESRR